jgi:hypothetical protein
VQAEIERLFTFSNEIVETNVSTAKGAKDHRGWNT